MSCFLPPLGCMACLAIKGYGESHRSCSTGRELRFGHYGALLGQPDSGYFRDTETGMHGGRRHMLVHAGYAQTLPYAACMLVANGPTVGKRRSRTKTGREALRVSR